MANSLGTTRVVSRSVWGPGPPISCNKVDYENINKEVTLEGDINGKGLTSSKLLVKYSSIWSRYYDESICSSEMKRQLTRCEQKLTEITDHEFEDCLYNFIHSSITSSMHTHTTNITTLLHILHVFSTPCQENKKKWLLLELNYSLENMSEKDLYSLHNEYIDQLMTRKKIVTEEDLCIGGIEPYYVLQLKLCYSEKLIKEKQFHKYRVFFTLNVDYVMSMSREIKERKDCITMSKTSIFFLQKITLHHQLDEIGDQNDTITSLNDLLSSLTEDNVYDTFQSYLEYAEKLNSLVTFEVLCRSIGNIDPYYKQQLQLCYCEMLIKRKHCKLYEELMVENLPFFIDVTTEACSSAENRTTSHDFDKQCDKKKQLENKEYRITELSSLLSRLLHKLPENRLYKTINHYVLLVKKMKSDITPQYLHSVKTDPFLELIFKMFWCRKLTNEGYADSNIVNRCLNNFYREKCQENKAKFIAQIISITDNLPENSLLKKLLQSFLGKNIKTVTSIETRSSHGYEDWEWKRKLNSTHNMNQQDLIYTQCASILCGKKMKNVDIKHYLRKLNIKGPEDEKEVEMQSEQVKLLILFILLLILTALGHKSANLKKYLTLKYDYEMASLYLLWCSGDIEVHPGPPWKKKQLDHNSERERKWLQELNAILLKLYWEIPTQSKPKHLWKRQPVHWPSDKPFYDTKNASNNIQGRKVSDGEILTCLLECLEKKNIGIPQTYQTEISAWRQRKIPLLCKLQIFRIEMENVKSATLNLFFANCDDEVKSLQNIKISLENSTLDKTQTDLLKKDCRQKKQTEMVADITRDLACTLCRLARGKNPTEKCDGIWNYPPPNHWLEDVPFFNPYNRGKYKDTCSDKELVRTFLELNLEIPKNLKVIVDAYQTLCSSKNSDEKKENKGKLCRSYIIQSNLEKLDYAIQCLHKEGLFSKEVHEILNQWWATQSFNEQTIHCLKNAIVKSEERPHITINVTKEFQQDADLGNISYTIPINDAYLHLKCTTVAPNQPSKDHALTAVLTTANNQDNIEDSVKHPESIQFLSDDKLFSGIHKYNGPKTSDSKRHESISSATHAYQETKTILDTRTSHNNQSSDINSSKIYIKYNGKSPQTCACDYSIVENLVSGNTGISKVQKRKHSDDNEETAKKLLKTKGNQLRHFDITDEEYSSAESKNSGETPEPHDNSKRNNVIICNNTELDSWSLDLSLVDASSVNNLGAMCKCKNSEDIQSCKQICNLENLVHQNEQYLLENINEMKNNDNQNDQIEDDQELESFSDLDNFISGKPSQMETDLLQ